ncbi:MAG: class I tRNA ligase family protein, partial [Patescibacteria group bacterium]
NPYYGLVMYPYPSGDKLHVGHWYNFGPADSYFRFQKMQGKDVFTPMGFDAFGLPAENYAIKTGTPPFKSTAKNVETMIKQLKRMGCMYDWSKTLNTSAPSYYRWTQWLFLQMLKNDLAYKKEGNVNFCPSCQTVLANEQVWDGKCERCESEVSQKPLTQWYWKITNYSDQLLKGLKKIDWPEKTKMMQRNWIGRSEGADVRFEIVDCQRGVIGPINWSSEDADVSRRFKSPANITDNDARIHSRMRTVHLVFTPYNRMHAFDEYIYAESILRILDDVAQRHDIVVHEASAMPEHVHLLVSFAQDRHLERDIVKKLKGSSAREFLQDDEWDSNHLWGEGKHFEDVDSEQQFTKVLKYIQENPSKAHIDPKARILSKLNLVLDTFTTTVDTIFGVTFVVISPEHPNLEELVTEEHKNDVTKYKKEAMSKTEIDRIAENREKTGVPTGSFVIHPFTDEKIPLWVADYVLMSYGTGVVMGVPAHDQRDLDFAKKYDFPVVQSIQNEEKESFVYDDVDKYNVKGEIVDSGEFTGMSIQDGRKKITGTLAKMKKGKAKIQFKIRDWTLSRQRYWGALIPIVYDPDGKPHPVPEEHLPWLLPTDVEFKPTGTSPIAGSKELKERVEKIFGKGWTPEVDTMDTFVCSSFYQFMYLSTDGYGIKTNNLRPPQADYGRQENQKPKNNLVDPEVEKKWMPVDMYIGGAEHACMHLIYARFVTMVLKDLGYVSVDEPFQALVHQGIITNDGAKMSKSKGNVVSPDAFVEKYGSDVFRMYLMFMGPFTEGGDWNDTGIKGISRFAQKAYKIIIQNKNCEQDKSLTAGLHVAIKKVTEDVERLHFNTAISALMEFLNACEKFGGIDEDSAKTFTKLLAPLAPHLSEELWEKLGGKGFVIEQQWPTFDPKLIKTDTITIAVQVNGKVRGEFEAPADISEADAIAQAKELPNVVKFIEGGVKKEIYVKGKLVSLVV